MQPNHAFLQVNGNKIRNQAHDEILLRGTCLGGWMNLENFVVGFAATGSQFQEVVARALEQERADYLFDCYLEYFFSDADAEFVKSMGLNLLRLPFHYRHFEDDMEPMVLRQAGFKHLDRVIKICAEHQIYTILDLHSAPGYQNQDWHSDNPTQRAFFWQHKHFQDRVIWLWEQLADHYKDNAWVAGYNLLNEPSDPSGKRIGAFYKRAADAIRKIDPQHIIFLEGNRFSLDFSVLGEPLPNAVYALHHYALPGFIDGEEYPGFTKGMYFDKQVLRDKLVETCRYMFENATPIWVGEFGPVYTGEPAQDEMRYHLLQDQLSLYREIGAHWSLWTYKDLGLHGLVNLRPDTKWIEAIQPMLRKKAILGADAWSGLDKDIRHIMMPIEEAFTEFFPNYKPYPFFDAHWTINRLVRNILLAEPINEDFYPILHGLAKSEIDELMASFKFENCAPRPELVEIISKEQQVATNPSAAC